MAGGSCLRAHHTDVVPARGQFIECRVTMGLLGVLQGGLARTRQASSRSLVRCLGRAADRRVRPAAASLHRPQTCELCSPERFRPTAGPAVCPLARCRRCHAIRQGASRTHGALSLGCRRRFGPRHEPIDVLGSSGGHGRYSEILVARAHARCIATTPAVLIRACGIMRSVTASLVQVASARLSPRTRAPVQVTRGRLRMKGTS